MSTSAPAPAETPPKRGWFATEGWRWLIVTILIPAAGFVWDRVQERQHRREQAFEDRRNQSELVIKLLPALSADPASSQRSVALAMLSDLAQKGAGGDSLFAAVNLTLQESDRRVRAGQASDSERAALTQIAMARDETTMRDAAPTIVSNTAKTEPAPDKPAATAAPDRPAVATAQRGYAITTPRLYVQVFDDSQVALADKLRADYAAERHWLTPGVENVARTAGSRGTKVPAGGRSARVVYFSNEDEARARTVVDWLHEHGMADATLQLSSLKAPAGQIEVWFPKA